LPVEVQSWVFDAAGEPRLTNARSTQRVNVRDREYFTATRDGAEYYISSLLTSRSTKRQVFVVARRIVREDQFVGTAVIVVPATYMETFRHSLELGPQSTIGLLRSDGMMVSRSPVPREATDLSGYVLFTDYLLHSDEGVYSATSPTDGVQRVVGYRRVSGFPLVAVASIATEEAFDSFWQTVGILAAVVGPGVLGLSFFGLQTSKAQVDLNAALERNQTLFREIHHRVKNNLQQVLALIQLQPLDAETKAEMARRIGAMVSVHEHMYRSDEYDHVSADTYLPPLIEGIRSSFAKPIAISVVVAPAVLNRDHALPLALICNEVIANAIKHAFPDGREGRIDMVLEQLLPNRAKLTIKDNGVGYDPGARSSGMGQRLIKSLASQVDGSANVDFDGGTFFTLEFSVLGFSGGPDYSPAQA
jgi:two-component sensor histidine kinase